jgi:hypothetical protein
LAAWTADGGGRLTLVNAAAAALIAVAASSIRLGPPSPSRALTEPHSSRGLAALLENYDGGDYAAIARDPTLARPDVYRTRAEAAYREQRPLFGELAWVGSLGDRGRVPITMAVLSVLSAAFAVMALGALLLRRQISPFFALGVFALPGVLPIVNDMMPELLQLGLITVGLLAWTTSPRRHARWAIFAFTLAALTRESSLLVPLVLIAMELPRIRSRSARHTIRLLTVPFVAYAAWIVFIRVRVGVWPMSARTGRLTAVPFGGLVNALQHSPYRGSTAFWFGAGLFVFGYALVRGRRDVWYFGAVAFAVMGVFLGWNVWQRPDYFGRVLLPLYAYSAIVLGSALWDRRAFVTLHRARSPAGSGVA